jgi:hypothetical protein
LRNDFFADSVAGYDRDLFLRTHGRKIAEIDGPTNRAAEGGGPHMIYFRAPRLPDATWFASL